MSDLAVIYEQLRRPLGERELSDAYRAACERGRSDIPPEQNSEHALSLLATAAPRLISLAVATYALHALPRRAARSASEPQLWQTITRTASGGLCRGDLAMRAHARAGGYAVADSLIVVYEQAAQALAAARLEREPPSLVEHSQQAGRWAAIAIEALDAGRPAASEAIIDCLANLLCVCVFADTAGRA